MTELYCPSIVQKLTIFYESFFPKLMTKSGVSAFKGEF